jgi:hypothetical protein
METSFNGFVNYRSFPPNPTSPTTHCRSLLSAPSRLAICPRATYASCTPSPFVSPGEPRAQCTSIATSAREAVLGAWGGLDFVLQVNAKPWPLKSGVRDLPRPNRARPWQIKPNLCQIEPVGILMGGHGRRRKGTRGWGMRAVVSGSRKVNIARGDFPAAEE